MKHHLRFAWPLLFAFQVVIGLLLFTHYGEAWDDGPLLMYGQNTLRAYTTFLRSSTWPRIVYPVADLEFYGVWPWVLVVLLHRVISSLHIIDVLHLTSWGFFLLATGSLYGVLRRWFSQEAALAATLLFATQPLLWGHGFINLKDTSTLSMMLVSLFLGLHFADRLPQWVRFPVRTSLLLVHRRISPSRRLRWSLGLLAAALIATFLALSYGYLARPSSAESWYIQVWFAHRILTVFFGGIIFLLLALVWTWRMQATPEYIRAFRLHIQEYARLTREMISSPWFWGGAVALGLSVSVRVSGWWVWLVILLLTWRVLHVQSLYPFFLLAMVALAIHYVTHPALFLRSPSRMLFFYSVSLRMASNFVWGGKVLFAGRFYAATDLPPYYVPWLHMIQTTEPALLLLALGLFLFGRRFGPDQAIQVFGLWYGVPVGLMVLYTPVLYDNARQVLFVLPGLYIPIAAAWEWLRSYLTKGWRGLALLLAITPGVLALVRLHPYQYIYYNALVGGVRGAFRRYETDYWATSFREVARALNQQCSRVRPIAVWGPVQPLADFLCPKFPVYSYRETERLKPPFYLVVFTRYNADQCLHPEAYGMYWVERAGAVLSVVRYVEEPPSWKSFRRCLP